MPEANEPYTAWAATTAFRKDGAPVLGTMGSSVRRVIVMEVETFKRMLREHPEFAAATQFRIGEMDG